MNDDDIIESMEIDLEIAECGEILTQHGITPTADLVTALWTWRDQKQCSE